MESAALTEENKKSGKRNRILTKTKLHYNSIVESMFFQF